MGRPEKTIDPAAGPVARFACELRQLRGAAGLSYRDMAARTHYSAGTLAQAADGRRLPSLALTLAYVQVCGGDAEDWRARWQELSREPRSAPVATESAAAPAPEPAARRRFGWLRWRHVRLAVVLLAVLAGVAAGGMMFVSANDDPGNLTFSSITGPSCVEDLVRGGYANNYQAGWQRAPGDWVRDGCDGWFKYAPLSGSATEARNYYTWWFKPGINGDASCIVEVFVPQSELAAAHAANYRIRSTAEGNDAGHFTVDQPANRGKWVTEGPFAVDGHLWSVRLADRSAEHGTVAAAALRVNCTRLPAG